MVQTTQMTLRDRIIHLEDAISAGRIDEAMDDCQQLRASYPDALEIQRLLGEVYLAQGRLEEAQQAFDWILINDPENVIVYCDRALICEHQSDIETALDCYQQAYELSRGNSQILGEFNALSKRTGQQAFMLSRAGLARLYMRGNLLTQAAQEWEAVLSATPDRLDARLGLLETCWREGFYNDAERMASSILEEVPQCLKALLLLAHVVSANNMQRARDLVAQAEKLDPELTMAQDLFSDVISGQPNDPFLRLINKGPLAPDEKAANGHGKPIDSMNTLQYATVEEGDGSSEDKSPTPNIYNWGDVDSWSELDTRSVPNAAQAQTQTQVASTGNGPASSEIAALARANTPSPVPPAQNEQIDDFDVWATQQEIDDDFDPALLEKQPWFQAEQADKPAAAHELAPVDNQPESTTQVDPWDAFTPKEEPSAPPAWLDMLTNFEQRSPANPSPSRLTPPVESTPAHEQAAPEPAEAADAAEPAKPLQGRSSEASHVRDQEDLSSLFLPDDKDEDMRWPEWLKSLGAEALEPEQAASGAEMEQPAYSNTWGETFQEPLTRHNAEPDFGQFIDQKQAQGEPESEAVFAWTAQLEQSGQSEQPMQAAALEKEAASITTLEFLEQSLLSQGFVPLQPGSLSTIAQDATPLAPSTLPAPSSPFAGEDDQPAVRDAAEAQLATQPLQSVEAEQSAQAEQTAPVEQVQDTNEPVPAGTQPEAPAEANPEVVATPAVPPAAQSESGQAQVYSLDMLLDSELEMTMRRPAVRLQPMEAVTTQADQPYSSTARGIDYSTKDSDSKLSNKERLVKGYQLQLAGRYDDAMQEYRALIRNAPELLGEVISNVRALLKLVPKYTAGYRVLGDAYMRQGEYLQAMEAYNKALTMAKKAKSQSR